VQNRQAPASPSHTKSIPVTLWRIFGTPSTSFLNKSIYSFDVSAKHYDHWDCIIEKREALPKWAAYIEGLVK